MRKVALAFLVLAFGSLHHTAFCRAEGTPTEAEKILSTEPVIPKEVVYKKTTAEKNKQAIAKLSKIFRAADVKEMRDEQLAFPLICGAGLWAKLKDDTELKKIGQGRVEIGVPTDKGLQKLDGKLFQSKDEAAAFWRALQRKFKPDPKAVIRRPTPTEFSLYWAMISFDIEEPIFMVETKEFIILANFTNDLNIAWIDDFKDVRFTKDK